MTASAAVQRGRYRAFLSYAHADTDWARWLHRQLEAYRVDKDLVGRQTPAGQVPHSLRPVFRDRDEARRTHDLSVIQERLGDVLMARQDFSGALAHYRSRHDIVERLAAADPANAPWRRDLGVSCTRIADALTGLGDVKGALAHRRRAYAIALQLSQTEPDQAGWMNDLAVARARLDDALAGRGAVTARPWVSR